MNFVDKVSQILENQGTAPFAKKQEDNKPNSQKQVGNKNLKFNPKSKVNINVIVDKLKGLDQEQRQILKKYFAQNPNVFHNIVQAKGKNVEKYIPESLEEAEGKGGVSKLKNALKAFALAVSLTCAAAAGQSCESIYQLDAYEQFNGWELDANLVAQRMGRRTVIGASLSDVLSLSSSFNYMSDDGRDDFWNNFVKTPAEFWREGGGDCDDFALFAAELLKMAQGGKTDNIRIIYAEMKWSTASGEETGVHAYIKFNGQNYEPQRADGSLWFEETKVLGEYSYEQFYEMMKKDNGPYNFRSINNLNSRFKSGEIKGVGAIPKDLVESTIYTLKSILNEEIGFTPKQKELYKKWKELVNMSPVALKKFVDSDLGKQAGLKQSEAAKLGIKSGRQSACWIIKMKNTPVKEWTKQMWDWAGRQVSFISRMKGNKGPLKDEKGNPTRKLLSLKVWGHNPK